jgi:hypothetical protein
LTERTDPRIAITQKKIDNLFKLAPGFDTVHELGALELDECNEIISCEFTSINFEVMFTAPSYQEWLLSQDFRRAMAFHKRFIQFLQHGREAKRWVLKSPGHQQYFPAILETYPDAAIVQTHRDPRAMLASISSLTFATRGLFSDANSPAAIGRDQADFWWKLLMQCVEDREKLSDRSDQFFDAQFTDIVTDPIGLVRRIYDYFDFDLSAETEARMERYLAENPQGKHGAHNYTLDTFGLDGETELARFSEYCDRFGLST